jgi:hypothetical protein
MKIYKYELPSVHGVNHIKTGQIQYTMHVDVVNGIPFMWCVVDETKEVITVVRTYFTGDNPPDMDSMIRIGTALLEHGQFVLHYYREAN